MKYVSDVLTFNDIIHMKETLENIKDKKIVFSLPTLIAFWLFIITTVWTWVKYCYTMEARMDSLVTRQDHVASLYQTTKSNYLDSVNRYDSLDKRIYSNDLIVMEIRTRLAGIETTLNEIKWKIN